MLNNDRPITPNKNSFNPVIIGIVLITLITAYFLWQTFNEKQKLQRLEKKLIEEKRESGKINVEIVSVEEVYQWIGNKNVQLIDIRNSAEYEIKHIESSINLPLDNIIKDLTKIDKTKKIVIIDKENSSKGQILTEHLTKEGLDSKYLDGGILNYARQNYPLVTTGNPSDITDQMKVTLITASEVREKMIKGKVLAFIDTRNSGAFNADSIAGSKNIPLENLENLKKSLPSRTILLYDSDPTRSFQAGVRLYDIGISNVYSCSDNYTILKRILLTEDKSSEN